MASTLFTPLGLGKIELPNRIVMAPMTRNRADENGVPASFVSAYYTQRASAGLIVTEATNASAHAIGYPYTPGIYTPEQVAAWKQIVQDVHAAGGRIVLQVFHTGRVSHSSLLPEGNLPVSASAIGLAGEVFTYHGKQAYETPRALETEEVEGIVEQYRQAALRALDAGFDGFEIHGANGYLLDQFLRDGSNRRTDEFGGSLENRVRLLKAVAEAVVEVWGEGRVGVRISPGNPFNGMHDSDPRALTAEIARTLNQLPLAYLHIVDAQPGHPMASPTGTAVLDVAREHFTGPIIANGGYTQELAEKALDANAADAIAFGMPYIANPDLVGRFKAGLALSMPDFDKLYVGGESGYVDYPAAATENA